MQDSISMQYCKQRACWTYKLKSRIDHNFWSKSKEGTVALNLIYSHCDFPAFSHKLLMVGPLKYVVQYGIYLSSEQLYSSGTISPWQTGFAHSDPPSTSKLTVNLPYHISHARMKSDIYTHDKSELTTKADWDFGFRTWIFE